MRWGRATPCVSRGDKPVNMIKQQIIGRRCLPNHSTRLVINHAVFDAVKIFVVLSIVRPYESTENGLTTEFVEWYRTTVEGVIDQEIC